MNGFDPDHHYYGPDGEKISTLEWGSRFARERFVGFDVINGFRLMTAYLGFVDPATPGARLFGTAIGAQDTGTTEVELYDSQADAIAGHQRHLTAIQDGFHCGQCRNGLDHEEG